MQARVVQIVGWAASIAGIIMFFAYIDQIRLNLHGNKGSFMQPAATVINCMLWAGYGAGKPQKDWPMIIANLTGIVLAAVTALTAL